MGEIVKKIEGMLEAFQVVEAFTFCQETIDKEGLSPAEQETLALQTIRCLIHTTKLETLFGWTDGDKAIIYPSEDGKESIELLKKYIFKLIRYLDINDQEKILSMYSQVCSFAHEWFLHFMPYYVQNVVDQETNKTNNRYYQGYLCLFYHITFDFYELQKMACIKNVTFPKEINKVYWQLANELARQAETLLEQVRAMSEDFPFFIKEDGTEVAMLYINADFLLSTAIKRMQESDACDAQQVLAWKKERVNIHVDRLNIILVVQGERQSLYYQQAHRTEIIEDIRKLEQQIQESEPDYCSPSYSQDGFTTVQSGGCYIATAVYGSYDCPQVWVLRRYRDQRLASTWCGRTFVRIYYRVSPVLVKWFGNSQSFQKIFRPMLEKLVSRLEAEGVAATPYADREW